MHKLSKSGQNNEFEKKHNTKTNANNGREIENDIK